MGLRDAWTALRRREVKASRAGPLIALQQPGRAVWSPRRFDAFAELEDQMCAMTADFERSSAGFSPDRVDARVWALSELMLGHAGEPRLRAL